MKGQETPLSAIIRQQIQQNGPMNLADYMTLCLAHPKYGYYMNQDPFGVEGDFITAPEIYQIFGELMGVWLADTWQQMGQPDPFILLECGAGRGTLMQDALRATKKVAGFHAAAQLVLLETSPFLIKEQAKRLGAYDPQWISVLSELPQEYPVLVIGNEFLDALSVRQLKRSDTGWEEVCIGLNENDTICFCECKAPDWVIEHIPPLLITSKQGDIVEVSMQQYNFIDDLLTILLNQGGSSLFVDYGFSHSVSGDTLQAVAKHQFCSILDNPGEVDITAHVNFSELSRWAMEKGLVVHDAISQSTFLRGLGAELRAEKLTAHASVQQAQEIKKALQRLIGEDTKGGEMGSLFKVIAFSSDPTLNLAGFA